jgi:demethylmenaquinone methyltransferase/2-methoxy-6-polyprenyl-1,4-benzoquinol methylase
MNRLMTFGCDGRWRRRTVRAALGGSRYIAHRHGEPPLLVLDVATGTGELALESLRLDPNLSVVGLDMVPEMLAVARAKDEVAEPHRETAGRLDLVLGDALRLPFPDRTFDAIVTGFALRNVLDIPAAFREMARVTRAGGRLACLEIAKPRLPIFRQAFALYFYQLVPLMGRLIAGEEPAYSYLPHSLSTFLTPEEIASVMRESGWHEVRHCRLMLGTVAVHAGVRG